VRRPSFFALIFVSVAMVFPAIASAQDARLAFLGRMLKGSGEYRVRVQAALSLGEIGGRGAVSPLVEALGDEHPAVRTAAAAALGRVGDASAVEPLEALSRDANAGARSAARRSLRSLRSALAEAQAPQEGAGEGETPAPVGRARFYIGVGDMGNRSGVRENELKGVLKRAIRDALGRSGSVRIAPDGESPQVSERAIKRDRLDGYFLTGSVLKMQPGAPGMLHAEVSVMVLTNPGRDLRMMLNGSADISSNGPNDTSAQDEVLQHAAASAVRRFASQIGAQ